MFLEINGHDFTKDKESLTEDKRTCLILII